MATISSNKFIPVLGVLTVAIVGAVIYMQFSGGKQSEGKPLTAIPAPTPAAQLPAASGADNDNPNETLRTVVVSNETLRKDVARIVEANDRLIEENRRLRGGKADSAETAPVSNSTGKAGTTLDGVSAQTIDPAGDSAAPSGASNKPAGNSSFDKAVRSSTDAVDTFAKAFHFDGGRTVRAPTETELANVRATSAPPPKSSVGAGSAGQLGEFSTEDSRAGEGHVTLAPMGYSAITESLPNAKSKSPAMTRYVRTSGADAYNNAMGGTASAALASQAATQAVATNANANAKATLPVPFFTVPENATLVGVTSMTSIIGRVPIDGRVTDPMQFKAIVGRDNLAANGFELPADLEGMIVTGIAVGDMALSCSEGKVRSITFVFNDGTVRTTSARSRNGSSGGSSGAAQDLGFISDEHGNPCIPGKFVTNAPSYLADLAMLKGLDVAAQSYAEAQRTISSNLQSGNTTSRVTGNMGGYAMAQAASGATDEVVRWMMSRLKSSFDAVITPSGRQLVVHIDQELQIDKLPTARKLQYRQQGGAQTARGEHHGLE
ncbi:TIGR03752 family integrating conjugative element protein [Diaphorobacter sp. HDW4A]|uniref:TIGR03752 family integrating conjugative element protein n=1 Tax=Diaphorobacter sp. HDW4A TaxID=2714924 RepID=UPI00140811A2|nr:TIGR03752 family integrating conjugative element protein [Diaphorobacter sp. HDW4A]QIL80331.1 TIGR03752 family integrating conjugative element protein [Diaphorobacter sp. HDW4A]